MKFWSIGSLPSVEIQVGAKRKRRFSTRVGASFRQCVVAEQPSGRAGQGQTSREPNCVTWADQGVPLMKMDNLAKVASFGGRPLVAILGHFGNPIVTSAMFRAAR